MTTILAAAAAAACAALTLKGGVPTWGNKTLFADVLFGDEGEWREDDGGDVDEESEKMKWNNKYLQLFLSQPIICIP